MMVLLDQQAANIKGAGMAVWRRGGYRGVEGIGVWRI